MKTFVAIVHFDGIEEYRGQIQTYNTAIALSVLRHKLLEGNLSALRSCDELEISIRESK